MTARFARRIAALGAVVFLALPLPAHGSFPQGCTATLDGADLAQADSPGRAVEVDADATVKVAGTAPGPVAAYQVFLDIGPLTFKISEGAGNGDKWSGTAEIKKYAKFGVGLYKVSAKTTGTVCAGNAYIRVTGRMALLTVAGATGSALALLGAAGATYTGLRRARGRRVAGAVSGVALGLGVGVLLQQFGLVPIGLLSGVVMPVGFGAAGIGLGWPIGTAAA